MVSVDAGLETLPGAFVTVTKQMSNLGTVDIYQNIRRWSFYWRFEIDRTYSSVRVSFVCLNVTIVFFCFFTKMNLGKVLGDSSQLGRVVKGLETLFVRLTAAYLSLS